MTATTPIAADVEPRQFVIRCVPLGHPLRDRFSDMDIYEIRIEYRDEDRWAVMFHGRVWTTKGWEWEPIPSSRTEAFRRRARFPLAKAIDIARERAAEELAHLEAKHGAGGLS
jgi:hypothetical protein